MFTKFSSRMNNILAIIFVLLVTFLRSLPWQQRVQNIGFFYYFSLLSTIYRVSFGEFFFKCHRWRYRLDPFNSLFSKKFYGADFFNVKQWYFLNIELERHSLCLELYRLSERFTKGNTSYSWAFLRMWRHTFPDC